MFNHVPKLRDQQDVGEEENEDDDELLSLSPQPSIVSTVTHGANNNKIPKVRGNGFDSSHFADASVSLSQDSRGQSPYIL